MSLTSATPSFKSKEIRTIFIKIAYSINKLPAIPGDKKNRMK